MNAKDLLNARLALLNSCVNYLCKHTRFNLSAYPEFLNENALVSISSLILETKYKCNDIFELSRLHSHLAQYIIKGYVFTHDGTTINVELPKCTVNEIIRSIMTHKIQQSTKEVLIALYVRKWSPRIDDILTVTRFDSHTLFHNLDGEYLLEYAKYLYTTFDTSNVIWSDDECRRILHMVPLAD